MFSHSQRPKEDLCFLGFPFACATTFDFDAADERVLAANGVWIENGYVAGGEYNFIGLMKAAFGLRFAPPRFAARLRDPPFFAPFRAPPRFLPPFFLVAMRSLLELVNGVEWFSL